MPVLDVTESDSEGEGAGALWEGGGGAVIQQSFTHDDTGHLTTVDLDLDLDV